MPASDVMYVPDVRRFSLGVTKQENMVFCMAAKEEFNSINKPEGSFTEVAILQPPLRRSALSQGVCPGTTQSSHEMSQLLGFA